MFKENLSISVDEIQRMIWTSLKSFAPSLPRVGGPRYALRGAGNIVKKDGLGHLVDVYEVEARRSGVDFATLN